MAVFAMADEINTCMRIRIPGHPRCINAIFRPKLRDAVAEFVCAKSREITDISASACSSNRAIGGVAAMAEEIAPGIVNLVELDERLAHAHDTRTCHSLLPHGVAELHRP